MLYEGKVLKDLIPRIYDRPGRVVPAMGADDKRRSIMVNIPFVEQSGSRRRCPTGTPGAEMIDLKDARALSVTAVVGKSYATRREETSQAIAAIMQAAPGLAPILAPYWLDELDFPGAKKLAAIAKKTLPPQFQEEEGGQPSRSDDPAAAAADRAGRADDRAADARSSRPRPRSSRRDTVKADAQVQVTQLELASKERIEAVKAQVELLKADVSAQTALQQATLGVQGATDRVALQGVQRSIQQLEAQAFQKDQQAAQQQQERDLAQLAAQQPPQPPQGGAGAPGMAGPPGAPGTPQGPGGGVRRYEKLCLTTRCSGIR